MANIQESKDVTLKVNEAQTNYINEQFERLSSEAIEALNLIGEILEAISQEDKERAIKACEKSLGRIELLLIKDPNLVTVPVDVKEEVVEYSGTLEDIVHTKIVVKELIDDNRIQEARAIMANLASELNIYITLLPVGTYPIAIKSVIPLIDSGKFDEAKALLIEILDTLLLEKVVIPLPVVRAQKAVEVASELTKDRDDASKDELRTLIEFAKEQLVIAQALGYGLVEEEYKNIFEEIESIESILNDDNKETSNIFEVLKDKLNSFISTFNKVSKDVQMPKAKES